VLYGHSSVIRLDGQVGLITGGGRGIGEAVARELVGAGMRVAVTGRTQAAADAEALVRLLVELRDRRSPEGWEVHDLLADGLSQLYATDPPAGTKQGGG